MHPIVRIAIQLTEEERARKALVEFMGTSVEMTRINPTTMELSVPPKWAQRFTKESQEVLLGKADAFLCGVLWTR